MYFDVLTSGGIAQFYSNSSDATARNLITINNDHASASEKVTTLDINQDSDGRSIYIDSENTTKIRHLFIDCTVLTSGGIATFYSNSSDATARILVSINNDHASAVGVTPLWINQDALTSTNFQKMINLDGTIIWRSNGTDPNGALSGTAGDICFNGATNKPAYCTGTTNWTSLV